MRRFYTEKEIQLIKDVYAFIPTIQLANILGRSEKAIYAQAFELGLHKNDYFKETYYKSLFTSDSVAAFNTRFKKGNIPPNKGKKQQEYMSAEAIAKTVNTRFKKGQQPHNTRYDGHERLTKDGYTEIRIKAGKYIYKHRLVYENAFGKIPKGMLIVFKDGNKQNITLENLELITLKENAIRNSPYTGKGTFTDKLVINSLAGGNRKDKSLMGVIDNCTPLIELKRTELQLLKTIKTQQKK